MAEAESRAARLLAEYYEWPIAETAAALNLSIAAFKQAMAEFGLPEHPGREVPRFRLPVLSAGAAGDRAGLRTARLGRCGE